MNNWWCWVLRGLAVVALVVGAVLLFTQPIPNTSSRVTGDSHEIVTFGCLSPFEQIRGRTLSVTGYPTPLVEAAGTDDNFVVECKSAASDHEHIVEALGAGAVILVGLSFLGRRRPVVIVPVNPSVL